MSLESPDSQAPAALAGYYEAGNFGDDLSAVLIGRWLQREQRPFSVLGLPPAWAAGQAFDAVDDVERLLSGARALVWGGGGLLVPWSAVTYRLLFGAAAKRLETLARTAVAQGLSVHAVSVGGDGRASGSLTPAFKQVLIDAARTITVRNPQDIDTARRLGKDASYFPDIVWGTAREFPVRRPRPGGRLRIGLDLYLSNLVRQRGLRLLTTIRTVVRQRRDCEFVCLDSTNTCYRPYRGIGRWLQGPNVTRWQFDRLEDSLGLLASLDLVVSSRFHVPVVAMQYGVPAISACPEPKTRLLYENLGLIDASFGGKRVSELARVLMEPTVTRAWMEAFRFPDTAQLARDAEGHFDVLRSGLDAGSAASCP
jgi:polysaccharide pyruvyl transferase WcaK-like protein